MAFLVMDLSYHGRRDLARTFTDAYFRSSGDNEGRRLLGLYAAYRAAARGKKELPDMSIRPGLSRLMQALEVLRTCGLWTTAFASPAPKPTQGDPPRFTPPRWHRMCSETNTI